MGAAMAGNGRSEEKKLHAGRAGLWREAAERAIAYRDGLAERRVAPDPAALDALARHLGGPLPERPVDPARMLEELDRFIRICARLLRLRRHVDLEQHIQPPLGPVLGQ